MSGKCGHKDEATFPCTFGMNTKGGMENEEFEEYTMTVMVCPCIRIQEMSMKSES